MEHREWETDREVKHVGRRLRFNSAETPESVGMTRKNQRNVLTARSQGVSVCIIVTVPTFTEVFQEQR